MWQIAVAIQKREVFQIVMSQGAFSIFPLTIPPEGGIFSVVLSKGLDPLLKLVVFDSQAATTGGRQ